MMRVDVDVADRKAAAPSAPPCVHLRRRFHVFTAELGGAPWPEEDGFGGGWCCLTQCEIGPDDEEVDAYQCVPGRSCYRPPQNEPGD